MIESEEIRGALVLGDLFGGKSLEDRKRVVFQHRLRIVACQVNWISPESKLKRFNSGYLWLGYLIIHPALSSIVVFL